MRKIELSSALRRKCRETMLRCEQCRRFDLLEALFAVAPLNSYIHDIRPDLGATALVDRVIALLYDKRAEDQWVFILFLEELRDVLPEADSRRVDLRGLIDEVGRALALSAGVQQQATNEANVFQRDFKNYERQQQALNSEAVDEAEAWIEAAGQDTNEWAFRIALAVFDGAAFDAFSQAARDLAEKIRLPAVPRSSRLSSRVQSPIPLGIGKRLKAAGATRVEAPINEADPEAGTIQKVKLTNPNLAYPALKYFWSEYDQWHTPFVEWLTMLAANHPVDIRTRAALVAGVLAAEDFTSVCHKILKVWLFKETHRAEYRAAVGKALSVVASEERRRTAVYGLLKRWATAPSEQLRWAAARAYSYVGLYYPADQVVQQWRIIADSEPMHADVALSSTLYLRLTNPLHTSLVDAMVAFFLNAATQPEQVQSVFESALKGIHVWVELDNPKTGTNRTGRLGLPLFLMLTHLLLFTDGQADSPPVFLHLVNPQIPESEYRKSLGQLFFHALKHPAFHEETWEQLQLWVRAGDSATQYRPHIKAVLDDIMRCDKRGRIHDRIMFYLNRWAHPRNPSPTAHWLLQQFT